MDLHHNERKTHLLELSQVARASYHAEKEDYARFVSDLEVDDG